MNKKLLLMHLYLMILMTMSFDSISWIMILKWRQLQKESKSKICLSMKDAKWVVEHMDMSIKRSVKMGASQVLIEYNLYNISLYFKTQLISTCIKLCLEHVLTWLFYVQIWFERICSQTNWRNRNIDVCMPRDCSESCLHSKETGVESN